MTTTDVGEGRVAVRAPWIRACVVGELAGFVPPAIAGAVLFTVGACEIVLVVGLVVAGVCEGLVLGSAQSRVIAALFPGVSGWTRATSTAAGVAWLAGMGGSALVQSAGPIALIVAVPAWAIGLLSMGVLQARCLAPVVDDASDWIVITTVAWLVGVTIPVMALSIVPNGWPLATHVVAAVVAAVAMGATVGAVSAGTLCRFVAARRAV